MADTPVAYAEEPDAELSRMMFSDNLDRLYVHLQARGPLRYVVLPSTTLAGKAIGEILEAGLSETQMFTRGPKVPWRDQQVAPLVPTARHRASALYRLYWDLANDLGHFRLVYETRQRVLFAQRFQPDPDEPQTQYTTELCAWPATEEESLTSLKALLEKPDQVHETTRGAIACARLAPEVRIFEIVPGALLEGHAPPGSEVVATLNLLAPTTQRRWTGRWSTRANQHGRFSLRVPYPTGISLNGDPESVKARGRYQVSVHRTNLEVSVDAEDVEGERRIELWGVSGHQLSGRTELSTSMP